MPDVESLPDALEGSFAPLAVGGADGSGDATDDGPLEERPQGPGGKAEASDLVGEPDAEGPPAAPTLLTVTAKDPPRSKRLSWWIAVVKSVESAMPDEHADGLAVWTWGLFEPLDDGEPILFASVEPSFSLVAHVDPMPPGKPLSVPAANGVRSRRGPIQIIGTKKRGLPLGINLIIGTEDYRNRAVKRVAPSDANSAIISPKCDHSEGKDTELSPASTR